MPDTDPHVDAFVSWFADWWLRRGRDLMDKDRDKPDTDAQPLFEA